MIVILNAALLSLSRVVSMPKFEPADFLRHLKAHEVTVAHVAPPIVGFLAKHPAVESVLPLPKLRELFSGAAPLGGDLASAAKARLGVQCVRQGYGMTEMSPASHIIPYHLADSKPASIGELIPSTECRILDTETGAAVGVGHRGEICISGPNVMKGYLNKPEETAACIDARGFMHTGDVGYIDADGCFYIVDRVKELIKVRRRGAPLRPLPEPPSASNAPPLRTGVAGRLAPPRRLAPGRAMYMHAHVRLPGRLAPGSLSHDSPAITRPACT